MIVLESVGDPNSIDEVWSEIARIGTPLLEANPEGHGFRATFLYRMNPRQLELLGDYPRVVVEFDGKVDYGTSWFELQRMASSNAWWAEVEIPETCVSLYTMHLGDESGLIHEDVHEPWPASFIDPLNHRPTTRVDSTYVRNIVETTPARSDPRVRGSRVVKLEADASRLEQPKRHHEPKHPTSEPTYPVWVYEPHHSLLGPDAAFPVALLMNGQFVEHVDLVALFDDAVATGKIPPVVVVTAGSVRGNQNAWGWRRGFGPPPMDDFLRQDLWPLIAASLPVSGKIHLAGWDYAAYAAVVTASRCQDLVASVTLLCPSLGEPGHHRRSKALLEEIPNLGTTGISLGTPPERDGPLSWNDEAVDEIRRAAASCSIEVTEVPQSDPNIHSAAHALVASLAIRLAPQ